MSASRILGSAPRMAFARCVAGILLALPFAHADAEDVASSDYAFVVRDAEVVLKDGVYRLNAHVDLHFSDVAMDALENGVPLTIAVEIEVAERRLWWFYTDVATLRQRYELQYHALSRQYLVTNLNSGAQRGFRALDGALAHLGNVRDLPMLDRRIVELDENYRVRLRAFLDIEALPSPLRPIAYVSSQWRLSSEWYEWRVPS